MKYIASCSGGKDSVATVIVAKEKGEPLNEVVYCEVMFDENISGEVPEHRDFIYNQLKPFVEKELQVPFVVLRSDKTYIDFFYHIVSKGPETGKTFGFPIPGMCAINRDCKIPPIQKYLKQQRGDFVQYIGIAADEPLRLARLKDTNKISLLDKYGYTEKAAKELCESYGLLSPVYSITDRNGCWFCMNCKDEEFSHMIRNHSALFDRLIELEKSAPERYRRYLTRSETPQQIKERILSYGEQIDIYEYLEGLQNEIE